MEEVPVGDSSLAHQCLAFCQTLASQGRTFSLSLTAGSSFIFSMESNGIAVPVQVVKKKSSPSTLRRNAKRRELFLKRKLESSVEMNAPSEYPPSASTVVGPPQLSSAMQVEGRPFQCGLCTASWIHTHNAIILNVHIISTSTSSHTTHSSKHTPLWSVHKLIFNWDLLEDSQRRQSHTRQHHLQVRDVVSASDPWQLGLVISVIDLYSVYNV